MCSFYDPRSYNECRESTAERVVDKEKANYCEFFDLADPEGKAAEKATALTKANSLFKD
jgi:hypothetical protein